MLRNWTTRWENISVLTSATQQFLFVCLFVVHHCCRACEASKEKKQLFTPIQPGPMSRAARGTKISQTLDFCISPQLQQRPAWLPVAMFAGNNRVETNRPSCRSLFLVCVFVCFFTPNSGNEEESCTPLTFCRPRDNNCTGSGAGKNPPERDFNTASASTQCCAPIRGAFNLLQTPSVVPARTASPLPERKQTTPVLQLGASRQDGLYNDSTFFLLIQSQTDVHVSANQSITDPVHSLFRM